MGRHTELRTPILLKHLGVRNKMQFERNGVLVSSSTPTRELRTVKKVVSVSSGDRDRLLYYTNGEFVAYLPRVYEKIVSLRLMSAQFPPLNLARAHAYSIGGPNTPSSNFTNKEDVALATPFPLVFDLEIEGLNKTDEGAVGASKSQYPDAFFAQIPTVHTTSVSSAQFIDYNDHTQHESIAKFTPPMGKLDRLRIRTRLHSQQASNPAAATALTRPGFIYWTSDQSAPVDATQTVEYTLLFEIEYMDNGFDDFSSLETHLSRGRGY
jgi:hypothetical protein